MVRHPRAGSSAGSVSWRSCRKSLRTARTGRSVVTLVVGEPGIGKTRLLDEAATIARAAGMRVLRGEADRAWREPMELWRGVHRSLGIEPLRDPTLPAEERRWDHLEIVGRRARRPARPALVVLEDLHWSDPTRHLGAPAPARALGRRPDRVRGHQPRSRAGHAPLGRPAPGLAGDLPRRARRRRRSASSPRRRRPVRPTADRRRRPARPHRRQPAVRPGTRPLARRERGRSARSSQGSFERFDDATQLGLATAAVAGAGTPLEMIAAATGRSSGVLGGALEPALSRGVLDRRVARSACASVTRCSPRPRRAFGDPHATRMRGWRRRGTPSTASTRGPRRPATG